MTLVVPTGTKCSHFDEVKFGDELMTAHYTYVSNKYTTVYHHTIELYPSRCDVFQNNQ